jgi:hypothetical protein
MRAAALAFALAGVLFGGWAAAQPAVSAIPPAPLPGMLPAPDQPLPGGEKVSQPLQPVDQPPPPPPVETPETPPPAVVKNTIHDRDAKTGQVLGSWWDSDELLIWWNKAAPVPALVTASRGARPVLGAPTTSVIVGGKAIDTQDSAGYRLAYGFSLNQEDTVGFEGRYFFLGTRTYSTSITDFGEDRYHAIGLPFINANTGREGVLTLANTGYSSSLISVFTSSRVQGAEANFIGNLYAGGGLKVHALAGYRFFQANEGLRVESTYLRYPTPATNFYQTLGMIADQFDGHNEFHGGQVGMMVDAHRGPFYVEITGKAALGTNFEMVRIDGATHLVTAAYPVPLLQSFHGGVYAQGTNIGQYTRSVFAVVPEGIFKVGLKLGDRGRFYIGYNFLYLSDAVRPGDQIDRTVNPRQIPLVALGRPYIGQDSPVPTLVRSDFWTQGLIIGFEARF